MVWRVSCRHSCWRIRSRVSCSSSVAGAPVIDLWWQIGLGLFGVVFLFLLITNPRRALMLLWFIGRSGLGGIGGGGGGGGGGFRGGGGRSGGGGATGHW